MFQTRGPQTAGSATYRTDIAIVGAGFSGLLVALQLLRKTTAARIFLIERASEFGRGLAYGAADPGHLLNVRASNMSAFPEEPEHFLQWLRLCAPPGAEQRGFVSRQLFGTYLQALLRASVEREGATGRLYILPDEAVALVDTGPRLGVRLALGHTIDVDHVILATGNLPPHDPPTMDAALAASDAYIGDPWSLASFSTLRPNDDVLLLGTGLTAVDIVMRLIARGHRGRITALSRRGLTPHRHEDLGPPPSPFAVPSRPSVTELLRLVRSRARQEGWRSAVDGLRPNAQRLWREASADERQRFLRHLRPWWDIHRHRLAPSVAATLDLLQASGQVSFVQGWIKRFEAVDNGIEVTWTTRGTTKRMMVGRVVNCTGPAGDLQKTGSPFLADLLAKGLARPDACRLGLDVDADCHVIGADGVANPNLLALGPMSRGAFWEITAVPDIRVQALLLAERLATRCEAQA
jgi:uncharacterized NAD(P)/FAD-binding protein YdhS